MTVGFVRTSVDSIAGFGGTSGEHPKANPMRIYGAEGAVADIGGCFAGRELKTILMRIYVGRAPCRSQPFVGSWCFYSDAVLVIN